LANGQIEVCLLVHAMKQSLARLLVVEWRVEKVWPEPALLPKWINKKSP
jgi:hypothetical protein